MKNARIPEVEIELRAQIEKARGAGISITHFDSHMATLLHTPELFGVFVNLSESYHLPIRLAQPPGFVKDGGVPSPQSLDRVLSIEPNVPPDQWRAYYEKLLASLPAGSYQLTVHLGFDDEEMRGATYDHPNWGAAWRQRDFDVLRSAEFRQFLREQGFILSTWRDLGAKR